MKKLLRACWIAATVASYVITLAVVAGAIWTWPLVLHLGVLYDQYQADVGLWEEFTAAADRFDPEAQPWEECPVDLPDGAGRLVFLQRSTHPFLAEYERQVRFETVCGPAATGWLIVNTGGRTAVNVYWYPRGQGEGPFVRLLEDRREHVLDLARSMTKAIERKDGIAYVEKVALGEASSGWREPVGAKPSGMSLSVDGQEGAKAPGPLAAGPGIYLGRIDERAGPLRFVPASEAPEETIAAGD